MSVQFPAAVPVYPDTVGGEVLGAAGGGLGLSRILDDYGLDIIALATKLGYGASTPAAGKVLRSSAGGVSVWGAVDLTSDVTGTLPTAKGGTGLTALGSGVATFLGTPSSANLRAALTDETGSGAAVFGTSPTIVTPTIASFANATHNHTNSAGGGTLPATAVPALALNSQTLSNPYKFRVSRNAAATAGNNTYAVVAFDTEQLDSNNNVSSGVYTAPVSGCYQFNWNVSAILSSGANEPILATLFVNSVETSRGNLTRAMNDNSSSGGDLLTLTAGDTVDIRAFCSINRSLAVGNIFSNFFSGFLVSHT